MKNIFGTQKNLREYHENGKIAYEFRVVSDDYSWEAAYDDQGNVTSFKDSDGFSCEKALDGLGRITSYKDSKGEHWKRIYNKDGTFEQINL